MQNFYIADEVTRSILDRLLHLSRQELRNPTAMHADGMIGAVIGSINMLPRAIAVRIRCEGFYTRGMHYQMSSSQLEVLWQDLTKNLAEDLAGIANDPSLASVDVADRPVTKGEKICVICQQMDSARKNGGNLLALARRLEIEASGTPASADAKLLVRHLSKKRITDYDTYDYEICRLISHAELSAGHIHWMR